MRGSKLIAWKTAHRPDAARTSYDAPKPKLWGRWITAISLPSRSLRALPCYVWWLPYQDSAPSSSIARLWLWL